MAFLPAADFPAADTTGWRQVRIRTTTASVSGNGGVGYAVPTAVNGGSELLILVPRAAHSLSRPTPPASQVSQVSQVSDPPAGWPASTPPPSDAWEPRLTHDTIAAVSRQQCYGTDRVLNETLGFAIVFQNPQQPRLDFGSYRDGAGRSHRPRGSHVPQVRA